MKPTVFGVLPDGREIRELTIRSKAGAEATVMEWGAVVRDMHVPLKGGTMQRVVLGLTSLDDYIRHSPHMGAIAGRYANRIRGGRFALDGESYQLPLNQEGKHTLHGGAQGYSRRPWTILDYAENFVVMSMHSPAGDHGFPGAMTITVRYTLREPATLRVGLVATCNAPTVINLCHHSYFNLDGSDDILDHTMEIRSDFHTPVDDDRVPTGEVHAVAGTLYDFREARPIRRAGPDGARFPYDNNFMLRGDRYEELANSSGRVVHAATVASPKNGLSMQVWTTEPAMQFYDGFKMDMKVPGLAGAVYKPSGGLCMEPQHVPDSPNLSHFPSTVMRPGEAWRQVTEYRFSS